MLKLRDDDGLALRFGLSEYEAKHCDLLVIAVVLCFGSVDAAMASGRLIVGPIVEADLRSELPRRFGGTLARRVARIASQRIRREIRSVFGEGYVESLRKRVH